MVSFNYWGHEGCTEQDRLVSESCTSSIKKKIIKMRPLTPNKMQININLFFVSRPKVKKYINKDPGIKNP